MLQSTADDTPRACARCATELPPRALACPACATLVHRARLEELAHLAANAAAAGDRATARDLWTEARALVPAGSEQHRLITVRLAALADEAVSGTAGVARKGHVGWRGAAGVVAAIVLLALGKLKFLLLGLSKLGTLASMFGFIAVYWSLYGWPLAIGLAVSIYVHEMGHVAMLRRLGIQAGAPLFLPGVGAMVMLREPVTDPVVDARIGLAGPVWGLGAAVAAWLVYFATGVPIWRALGELTAFLNLFNLMPFWQLDGARGFHALSRHERWSVTAVAAGAVWLTSVPVLWIVGGIAAFRAWKDAPGPGHTPTLVTFCVLLLALGWLARGVR